MKTKMKINRNDYHELQKWWNTYLPDLLYMMSAHVDESMPESPDWSEVLTEAEASELICDLMMSFGMSGKIVTKTNHIEVEMA
jgi:hypothetical protein